MNTEHTSAALARLLNWYETLSPSSVALTSEHYRRQTYFKDPFNELQSAEQVEKLMRRMFQKLAAPRFEFHERIVQNRQAFVTWSFYCNVRHHPLHIRGSSHLRFADDGRVEYHRDYWDVAEEILAKLPGIGWCMRRLARHVG